MTTDAIASFCIEQYSLGDFPPVDSISAFFFPAFACHRIDGEASVICRWMTRIIRNLADFAGGRLVGYVARSLVGLVRYEIVVVPFWDVIV